MSGYVPNFRRASILSSLSQQAQSDIERTTEEKAFSRRQIIFEADQKNDNVYVLVSGRVKLVKASRSGRELTVSLINPNDIFGEVSLFEKDATYGVSAEVIEECVVSIIDRETLSAFVQNSVSALRAYAVLQDHRRVAVELRLAEHVFYDVPRRIALLLERLVSEHGRVTKAGYLLRIKLTHQDIANLVGSTRETTTLVLNDFRRRGLIDFSGRRIVVSDLDEIAKLT